MWQVQQLTELCQRIQQCLYVGSYFSYKRVMVVSTFEIPLEHTLCSTEVNGINVNINFILVAAYNHQHRLQYNLNAKGKADHYKYSFLIHHYYLSDLRATFHVLYSREYSHSYLFK